MTTDKIPFVDLHLQYLNIKKEIDDSLNKVINKCVFIQGEEVAEFELEFADYLGSKYCVTVNSGTDALILGMRVLNLSAGDEVIIPANTFFATALAAVENQLKPVFVDIDESDLLINIDDLEKKINSRTKAIILVHLYGQPEKISEIKSLINKKNKKIYLVEDACQAHGAEYKGKKVGNFGVFSAFSFYPSKNLGAIGDGGAIVVDNKKLADKIKLLRQYGSIKKYYHQSLGINSRLDTIQAAILRVKLKYLNRWNQLRREKAKAYTSKLIKALPFIKTPKEFDGRKSVYHLYVIRTKKRDKLLSFLNKNGVQALIHYPLPLHLQKAFSYLNYQKGDLPTAEKISEELLSLPIYPEITENQIDRIISLTEKFFETP